MPLDESSRESIEAFHKYVQDSVASDDRYGPARPYDGEDESAFTTLFEAGPSCWFEVAVHPLVPQIRVGFLTSDAEMNAEIEQAIGDSGNTMEAFVGVGFAEAGLDWSEPTVEHYHEGDEYYSFATPLAIDEPADLDMPEILNKTLRMLEGYLIAFGPAVIIEEEE